ncbi:unnamed protein product [Phaeothamnion confervicola]
MQESASSAALSETSVGGASLENDAWSTSEEEGGGDSYDLSNLGHGECSGFLEKRGSGNCDQWRRRWCVLAGERLWLTRDKNQTGAARFIPLAGVSVRDSSKGLGMANVFELHVGHHVYCFRAESRAKQVAWMAELEHAAQAASENDFIAVAEHMICDEESSRSRRSNAAILAAAAARRAEARLKEDGEATAR